ncbi:MAG TPA: signal peptidase I [Candidatus Limnocylindria bacterium]|nr:signal peptidase I [Candidatus Limnocylindria bacterium]
MKAGRSNTRSGPPVAVALAGLAGMVSRRSLALSGAALLLCTLWLLLLRPVVLGGPASYLVVSGASMEPALRSGDLVVAVRADAYAVGDIVAFHTDGGLVVHRIVGSDDSGFVVQGDSRASPDIWRPEATEILGAVRFQVPFGGRLIEILRTPFSLGLAAAAATFLLIAGGRVTPRTEARP